MVQSVRERHEALEEDFQREAASLGIDVCAYRLFNDDPGETTALSVAKAIETFQALLSNVYGALKTRGPRTGARLPADVVAETSLNFGYAFSGSVGLAFTLPNARLLFGESQLDEAFSTIATMSKAEQPGEIAVFAERLGPASVRALYKWSSTLGTAGMGADIQWRRDAEIRGSVTLESVELDRLAATIGQTSDAQTESVTLSGMLVALDTERRSFRLVFEVGDDIHGVVGPSVSFDEPARVPARYQATMTKETRVQYATEVDDVTWILERLTLV